MFGGNECEPNQTNGKKGCVSCTLYYMANICGKIDREEKREKEVDRRKSGLSI